MTSQFEVKVIRELPRIECNFYELMTLKATANFLFELEITPYWLSIPVSHELNKQFRSRYRRTLKITFSQINLAATTEKVIQNWKLYDVFRNYGNRCQLVISSTSKEKSFSDFSQRHMWHHRWSINRTDKNVPTFFRFFAIFKPPNARLKKSYRVRAESSISFPRNRTKKRHFIVQFYDVPRWKKGHAGLLFLQDFCVMKCLLHPFVAVRVASLPNAPIDQ